MFVEDMSAFFNSSDFGDDCVHVASDYTETNTVVIFTRGQEVIGEYAESVAFVDTVLVNLTEITPSVNDTLTVSTGLNSGEWKFIRKLLDDGVTATYEVRLQ